MSTTSAAATLEAALRELGVEYQRFDERAFAVALPGERRLTTACWLTVGAHAVEIEAFLMRRPEENREQVYAHLLRQNVRTFAVSWAIDAVGDVYLVGRLPLAALDAGELDRVLGCVLSYADGAFNRLLELGFASSIRREWAWRVKRGESLENLAAFAEVAQRPAAEAE